MWALIMSPMHSMWPTNLNLDYIILIILEGNELWRFSLKKTLNLTDHISLPYQAAVKIVLFHVLIFVSLDGKMSLWGRTVWKDTRARTSYQHLQFVIYSQVHQLPVCCTSFVSWASLVCEGLQCMKLVDWRSFLRIISRFVYNVLFWKNKK